MRVVIAEFMDRSAVASLQSAHDVHYDEALVDRVTDLEAMVRDAHALIVRNRTQVNAALLTHAGRLRVVGRLGVGLDNIDVERCRSLGIEVIAAVGANSRAVAEYVIVVAISLLRGISDSTVDVAAGAWPRARMSHGRELAGKTLGIIGFGSIGREVAGLARALQMRVIAHDPMLSADVPAWREMSVEPFGLEALLASSDVVTIHVPLRADTRHLIDADALRSMKPDAVIINTARGGVVDEPAIATALRENRLGGAALDVYETEPLPSGSPLAGCPRLILTPHIAGVTAESNVRVSTMIAREVDRALTRSSR